MGNSGGISETWKVFCDKVRPVTERMGKVFGRVASVFRFIGTWAYKLRKIFMAIPVLIAAIYLALQNSALLPEEVGLEMLSTGEFSVVVDRGVAVLGPLAVTAACLLLMFCSRRTTYPWLISIFTLVLPILLLILNNYPA